MKIVSLNTWGGKLFDPLINFIKDYSKEVDIFCFQEVYNSPVIQELSRGMRSNLFLEMTKVLSDFNGFFVPTLKQHDVEGDVNFDLDNGLALFVKKSIQVKTHGDIFVYRNRGDKLINDDYKTIPRNLQFITFDQNEEKYLLCHFHGIWYPKTKLDTAERLEQSKKIKKFLNSFSGKKILCGDFNLLPDTKSMHILEEGMKNLIKDFNIPTTRNKFYEREEKHADYILVSENIKIIDFKIPDVTVSDHLPLLLEFS